MTADAIEVVAEAAVEDPKSIWIRDPLPRKAFGVFLFAAWIVATILWVATNIHLVAEGQTVNAFTAVGALALMGLLGCMEGLEVSVVDRWEQLWPGRPTGVLARWLAARQLFVAVIVTAATLLADRSVIVIPFTSARLTGGFATGVFDLLWVTLTVLWFAQIFPKHMAAMNPDRYLDCLRRPMFPIVAFVHAVGISQPGEWTADAVESGLKWPLSREEAKKRRSRLAHPHSLGAIWCELRAPLRGKRDRRRPDGP